jgi:ubiquinol-cytochrome c reductase iron-sulfur subunit
MEPGDAADPGPARAGRPRSVTAEPRPDRAEPPVPASAAAATVGLAIALLVSTSAAIGLTVVYANGGQPQLEGALLATSLGGMAVALGWWAKHQMPGADAVEQRHPLASTPEEREAFAADFRAGEQPIARRRLLVGLLGTAATALGVAALFPIRSLGPSPGGSLKSTGFGARTRLVDSDGEPVKVDTVQYDGVITVFPEGAVGRADSQTLLLRLPAGVDRPRQGRETWSVEGCVAYSKVCTHVGCPVGLYNTQTRELLCPCHQSLFDVTDGARPVFGPATRSLPQLPLALDDDGYLVAQSDYTEPIGPGYWDRG